MPRPGGWSYHQVTRVLLLVGLVVVGVVAATMLLRGVDPVEVSATLFFAPVFAAALFLGPVGGGVAGAAAAVAYVLLRIPAIELVGLPVLAGLLASRTLGLLAFGIVAGWGASTLRTAVDKLELYDEIDDETGLGNARSVVNRVDTERSRATRYAGIFSVVVASFEDRALDPLAPRRQRALLRALGRKLEAGIRESDHAAHTREAGRHLLALVLPETAREGAATVAGKLEQQLAEAVDAPVVVEIVTFPGDEEALEGVVARFRGIDSAEHPRR